MNPAPIPPSLRHAIERSKRERRSRPELRQFVVEVVRQALLAHYSGNYSVRCLQASLGVQWVLRRLGVSCRIFKGAMCIIEAYGEPPDSLAWGGFWDRDHHVWAVTEFTEIVDIGISHGHVHPKASRTDGVPLPVFWWDRPDLGPPLYLYLPDGAIDPRLNPDDQEDLERFLAVLADALDQGVASIPLPEFRGAMLTDLQSVQRLLDAKDPWALAAIQAAQLGLSLPPWMQLREAELRRAASHRRTS